VRAGSYQQAHRDPFDRLLAAQAELEGLQLVSLDPALATSPVACSGDGMTTSAQIRNQLIQALELDLIGPTPGGAAGARRGRPPKMVQAGETMASKIKQMGSG
jgi:hypothetical protein